MVRNDESKFDVVKGGKPPNEKIIMMPDTPFHAWIKANIPKGAGWVAYPHETMVQLLKKAEELNLGPEAVRVEIQKLFFRYAKGIPMQEMAAGVCLPLMDKIYCIDCLYKDDLRLAIEEIDPDPEMHPILSKYIKDGEEIFCDECKKQIT